MAAMLAAAVVTAGVAGFAVRVVMVVTVNIGIVAQISAEQRVHRRVSLPADAAVELDTRLGQCRLRAAADAAANQSIHALPRQEACQRAVTAAVGINDFRMDDFAVRGFINLELLGVSEMLENLTVLIGNRNFHHGISFVFVVFFCICFWVPTAAATVGCLPASTDAVVSPCDLQRLPMDKACRDLAPRAFVNLLHCGAGNIHLSGALLMGLQLQINQSNDLVFVQRQQDRLSVPVPVWTERVNLRYSANPTASRRPWHGYAPLFRYIPIITL